MAIDTIFERAQLEQRVDIEGLRLLHLAVDAHGPWAGGQAPGVLRGLVLLYSKFVEVVVVSDVLEAGELLAGGGERALHGLKFCAGVRGNARRNHLGQPLDAQCSHGSGSGCAEEAAAIHVAVVFGSESDLGRGNVGRFADEHRVTSHGEVLNTIIRHDEGDGRYKICLRDSRFPTDGAEWAVIRP